MYLTCPRSFCFYEISISGWIKYIYRLYIFTYNRNLKRFVWVWWWNEKINVPESLEYLDNL